jgi:hypothetical protein
MRRSNRPQWFFDKAGQLLGLALGSDSCAEHETGIEGLERLFQLDMSKDGIERRRITVLPPDLSFQSGRATSGGGFDAIFCQATWLSHGLEGRMKDGALRFYRDCPLACAWDERSFGAVAYGVESSIDRERLRRLRKAFEEKDIGIWTNVGVFHSGGGLILRILSTVTEQEAKEILQEDLDERRLQKEFEACGIKEELRKAGKRWIGLSARWADDKKTMRFWLNPYSGDAQYGWYTLEELKQWAKGTGPVLQKR